MLLTTTVTFFSGSLCADIWLLFVFQGELKRGDRNSTTMKKQQAFCFY